MRRKNLPASKTPQDARLSRIDQEIIRREAVDLANDFRKFVEPAWAIIEPGTDFLPGVAIDAICQHLTACAEGKIRKLLVNIPPRHSKSSLINVLFPAWLWTRNATTKVLSGSYSLQLATRDAAQSRRIVESDWYRARWPEVVLSDDTNLKTHYITTAMGSRQTTSVGGSVTGLGGDVLIMDDPHQVAEAESPTVREATLTWLKEAWWSRSNNKNVVRIIVMQRVHFKDASAWALEQGGWDHLNLPMEFEGQPSPPTSLGWTDPRTEIGAVLWPERFSAAEVEDLKKMGSYAYNAQYLMRPAPRGGGLFKRAWCRFWYDPELGPPEPVTYQDERGDWHESPQRSLVFDRGSEIQSWDAAFKATAQSDFVVGQVWARHRADFVLLDQERGRFDFPDTKAAIRRLHERWPTATTLVEEKANGAAIISDLRNEIVGLIPVLPEGGKESRASAIASAFESGNVYLPHPEQHPWVLEFLTELTQFPKGAHDDQVDAMSQAIIRMRERKIEVVDMGLGEGSQHRGELLISDSYWGS